MKNLFLFTLLLVALQVNAVVTDLKAECRKGKTFVTWTDIADTTATYRIYRSTNPVTSLAGLTPAAVAVANSAYDKRYQFYHIVADSGLPLDTGTGLFVYTPKNNGNAYYAVTPVIGAVENDSIVSESNSLAAPVAEVHQKWPGGVLRSYSAPYSRFWMFYFWMDYDDWQHNYDYYGDLFQVSLVAYKLGQKNLPLETFLHGYSGVDGYSQPGGYSSNGYTLNIKDNSIPGEDFNHTWWNGFSNHYQVHPFQKGDTIIDYTAMRYIAYLHAVKRDARFSIDTQRIYLAGQSMGGGGTLLIGCHYPDLFAAFNPVIARMNYPESMFAGQWGPVSLGLTARNGVHIYKWNNVGWILENMRRTEMAPVIDLCGSKDGLHPFYTHAYFYDLMQKNGQGVWAKWLNIGHETASYGSSVPGGMLRFLRNEMFPAFSNATAGNSPYGTVTQADTFNIPVQPVPFTFDSVGTLNCQLDWSSSLHRLGLPGDSLIDSFDSLRITFMSGLATGAVNVDSVRVDITPRRLQRFPAAAGLAYHWTNTALSGSLVDSGSVTGDSLGIFTIPQFLTTSGGNRLRVTHGILSRIVSTPATLSAPVLSASPNPFKSANLLRCSGLKSGRYQMKVMDIRGRVIFQQQVGSSELIRGITWTAGQAGSGVYTVALSGQGSLLTSRIMLAR